MFTPFSLFNLFKIAARLRAGGSFESLNSLTQDDGITQLRQDDGTTELTTD